MDDNNKIAENKNVAEASKNSKKGKKDNRKESIFKRFIDKCSGIFRDYKGEYKKIIWPSRKELIRQSASVIVTCAIIGGIIAGLDFLFASSLSYLFSLFLNVV